MRNMPLLTELGSCRDDQSTNMMRLRRYQTDTLRTLSCIYESAQLSHKWEASSVLPPVNYGPPGGPRGGALPSGCGLPTVAATAFHARFTTRRQVHVEGARAAMRFAGNCRGEWETPLVAKITRQGKLSESISKCGLESHRDNLAVGLEDGAVGSAIQVAK